MPCQLPDLSNPRKKVNLLHIVAVAPLLAYIGYNGSKGIPIDQRIHYLLLAISLMVLAYHGYRLMN